MFEKIVTAILCTILSAQVFANANTNVCENELRDRLYSRMDSDASYAAMVEQLSPRIAKNWRKSKSLEEDNTSGYQAMVLSTYRHIVKSFAPGLILQTQKADDLYKETSCTHHVTSMATEHENLISHFLKGDVEDITHSVDADRNNRIRIRSMAHPIMAKDYMLED